MLQFSFLSVVYGKKLDRVGIFVPSKLKTTKNFQNNREKQEKKVNRKTGIFKHKQIFYKIQNL